jgi:hypothetical protein
MAPILTGEERARRESIEYKTSMIRDADPLRELLFY